MNEVKVSTQLKGPKQQQLALKFDFQQMGLDWSVSDTLRVRCFKKENKIVLEKVANKYSKQIAYNITSAGSGCSTHDKSIYIAQKNTRFARLSKVNGVGVAARLVGNKLEIHLPKEIFAGDISHG